MYSAKLLSAASAEDYLRECVVGAIALLSAERELDSRSSCHFFLHHKECLFRYNSFVVVLDIVLRHNAGILYPLFTEAVHGVGLLQERIAHVLLISQNQAYAVIMPFCASASIRNAITLQSLSNLLAACALKILPEDTLDDFCLFRIDDQVPFIVLVVAEKAAGIDHHFPLLETVLHSDFYVLAERFRFLLSKRRHNGQEDLSLRVHRVYGFLLEEYRNVHLLEHSDIVQAVNGISGKSADRLRKDHVDQALLAVLDHSVELLSAFGRSRTDAVIGIHLDKFPLRVLIDKFSVVLDLCFVACSLFLVVSRNTAIGCNTQLLDFLLRRIIAFLWLGRYFYNIHFLTPIRL